MKYLDFLCMGTNHTYAFNMEKFICYKIIDIEPKIFKFSLSFDHGVRFEGYFLKSSLDNFLNFFCEHISDDEKGEMITYCETLESCQEAKIQMEI